MTNETGTINRHPVENGLALTYDDLIWLHAEWLASRAVDKKTRRDYAQKSSYFVEWWRDYGPHANWRLTKRHLTSTRPEQLGFEAWLCQRRAKHSGQLLAWHTRNDALRRVREMLRWAQNFKIIEGVDAAALIPAATGETPERTAPTVAHLKQLMEAAALSNSPLRDQTILAVFIGTGIRRIELARLEVKHIALCEDGSGTAQIVGKRTLANKSGRRVVAFDSFTGHYLINYLDEMGISEGPLFFSKQSRKALHEQGVYRMVKRTILAAGLGNMIQGCHDLRRAFATILSLNDVNDPVFIDMIRRQLGHKHFDQTAQYTKINAEHIRQRIMSPLALHRGRLASGDKPGDPA